MAVVLCTSALRGVGLGFRVRGVEGVQGVKGVWGVKGGGLGGLRGLGGLEGLRFRVEGLGGLNCRFRAQGSEQPFSGRRDLGFRSVWGFGRGRSLLPIPERQLQ